MTGVDDRAQAKKTTQDQAAVLGPAQEITGC